MSRIADVVRTIRYMKRNGVLNAYYAAKERMELNAASDYTYAVPDDGELANQRKITEEEGKWPHIALVIPAYNTPEQYLTEAIESVIQQSYSNWMLVISDASDDEGVRKTVKRYDQDARIRYLKLDENKGISENTNAGIEYVLESDEGDVDYIGFMDHDDVLTLDALYHMACAILQDIDVDRNGHNNIYNNTDYQSKCPGTTHGPALLYSDEDKMTEIDAGQFEYFDPHRKYDFNYDLLLTNNYICHLMLVRADIMRKIRFRGAYDGAQDYDLVLQVVRYLIEGREIASLSDHIIHVPHILYHWRSHPGSTATNVASKTYAYDAGLNALADHIRTIYGETVSVSHSKHLGFYTADWGDIDDIFRLRPEIGAVIGRVIDKHGRMSECIADKDGKWLYAGINKHYAGAFNRFDCAQDVYMADPDHLRIRPELVHLKEICPDMRVLSDSLHTQHYLILYLPYELKRDGV